MADHNNAGTTSVAEKAPMARLAARRHRGAPAVSSYYAAAALVAVTSQILETSHLITAGAVTLLIRWAHTVDRHDTSSEVA